MTPPSELRRHKERAIYTNEAITSLFSDCYFAHVAYVDEEGRPHCLPMIAVTRTEEGEEPAIYLHGHPSARLMEIVKQNNSEHKTRVCVTATKVDGLVLSSAPNGHTFNYRAAVVHGKCSLVTDLTLKRTIMKDVTNHIVAGRWEEVNPVASFQVSLVCILRVDITGSSLKFRTGIPGIQPRNREKDGPDNEVPAWTGTVPLWEHLSTPVPSGLTDDAVVPESLERYIQNRNDKHKSYSLSVAK